MKLALVAGVALLGFATPVYAVPVANPVMEMVREALYRVTESKEVVEPTFAGDDAARRSQVLLEDQAADDLRCRVIYLVNFRSTDCDQ